MDGRPTPRVSGVDLQVVNGVEPGGHGLDTLNGTGNLVVGCARVNRAYTVSRTGSHHLVLGDTSDWNTAGGRAAAVVGGYGNTSPGEYAAVLGGEVNTVTGRLSTVVGGSVNGASGTGASVTAGTQNDAVGGLSSILGGNGNTVTTQYVVDATP